MFKALKELLFGSVTITTIEYDDSEYDEAMRAVRDALNEQLTDLEDYCVTIKRVAV